MLNASRRHCGRHHGYRFRSGDRLACSTPRGVTVVGTASRARLRSGCTCAQRLAASLWSARVPAGPDRRLLRVLNASRRHCGRHVFRPALIDGFSVCSTPRGVTVVGTPPPGAAPGGQQVLNASRRHCGRHNTVITGSAGGPWTCSTPRGVTVVGTAVTVRDTVAVSGCSTPRGVTVVGTQHTSARFSSRGRCAQRLAASLWSARPGTQLLLVLLRVLNASRRHCGRHLAPASLAVLEDHVLNASRRHCGRHRSDSRQLPL